MLSLWNELLFQSLPFGLPVHGYVLFCPCAWSPVCETLRIAYLLRDHGLAGAKLMFQREAKGSRNPKVHLQGGMWFHSSWVDGTISESCSSQAEPISALEPGRSPNTGYDFARDGLAAVTLHSCLTTRGKVPSWHLLLKKVLQGSSEMKNKAVSKRSGSNLAHSHPKVGCSQAAA